jgi:hypothetical protein
MERLEVSRNAFDAGQEVRAPDGTIGSVTDYAVLQVSSTDARAAVEEAKKGWFLIHDLAREKQRRAAERAITWIRSPRRDARSRKQVEPTDAGPALREITRVDMTRGKV